MSWRKEHKEHPWTTPTQAKRIAHDHAKQKHEHQHKPQKGHQGFNALKAANKDFQGLFNGAKRISQHGKEI